MAVARRHAVSVALALSTILPSGCDDRMDQCNRLIDAVNPHTETVSRAVEGLAAIETRREAPAELARLVDEADAALSVVALDDPKLAGWLLAYRKQLAAAKAASEAVAAAAASGDPTAMYEAVASADQVVASQDALLREINRYCAPPEP